MVLLPDSAKVPALTVIAPAVLMVPDSVVVPVPSLTKSVTPVSPVTPPEKVVLVLSEPKVNPDAPKADVRAIDPTLPDSESTDTNALSRPSVPPVTARSPISRVTPPLSMFRLPAVSVVAPV